MKCGICLVTSCLHRLVNKGTRPWPTPDIQPSLRSEARRLSIHEYYSYSWIQSAMTIPIPDYSAPWLFLFLNTGSCNLFNSNPSIPAEPWVCKVCGDPNCYLVSLEFGCHCQNIRGDPPAQCYGFKEKRKEKCPVCESAGYYSDPGSDTEPRTQFSLRTPQQTQRFEPATPVSKRKRGSSVSAVATVVSNNIIIYWDHLKQAKEALENEIITQEDYDLKARFLKKLKEM